MRKSMRHDKILDLLKEQQEVRVNDLALLFETSKLTIRKDLNELSGKGKIYRTFGGAAHVENSELPLQKRRRLNTSLKHLIAEEALKLIHDADSIFLSDGTTTEQLASLLSSFAKLSVITPALNIVSILQSCENITVYVPEGRVDNRSCSIVGAHVEATLQKYSTHIMFFGVDGIILEQGILYDNYETKSITQVMLKNSQKRVLLSDSSKFGKIAPIKLCGFIDIDILITDGGIPDVYKAAFEAAGVRVIIANSDG